MNLYHRDIRQYIGKRSMIRVKAAVIALNESGEILLLKRQAKDVWGLPIGKLKPGESMEDAAARELWEESGLTADAMRLINLISGPQYMKKYRNGDEEYYVIGVYSASGLRSAIDLPPESDVSLKYFDLDLLPPMDSVTGPLIDMIRCQIR
ncbi:NUDIX domain-containing protein [Paenibacillus sp. DMB20]|uniref:NUDIX domain-containing protein n=1 Tax=Paenibacillus sp. DMB20 TaxID=1642570 RepID=UPI0006279888|nr:NUDIX domain-containing protein [Paenibacillus sp. DMB20]KKO53344.1 NUDIX hydrolase [Paenibacillus sp. DMB20]